MKTFCRHTRQIFGLTIISISLACGQSRSTKLTVILFDNQNSNLQVTIDTLIKAKLIDIRKTPVDLDFISRNFHLPYYVPTNGIYKNVEKEQECDMKTYPGNVKCYKYDSNNRVIKMTVNGSGAMNNFTYQYNDKNQVVEIQDNDHDKFSLTYNPNGAIAELKNSDNDLTKRLIFICE